MHSGDCSGFHLDLIMIDLEDEREYNHIAFTQNTFSGSVVLSYQSWHLNLPSST